MIEMNLVCDGCGNVCKRMKHGGNRSTERIRIVGKTFFKWTCNIHKGRDFCPICWKHIVENYLPPGYTKPIIKEEA